MQPHVLYGVGIAKPVIGGTATILPPSDEGRGTRSSWCGAAASDKGNFVTIEHVNAQSLLGNMDEVTLLLKDCNIDILC